MKKTGMCITALATAALVVLCMEKDKKGVSPSLEKENIVMGDWKERVIKFCSLEKGFCLDDLELGEAATVEMLGDFSERVGFVMTDEFVSFYSTYDGFGLVEKNNVNWFFVKLNRIPELHEKIRSRISETHPRISKRFIPFIDWGNGDVSGFLATRRGEVGDEIYMFSHELYSSEKDHPWQEFLFPIASSIEEFLGD